jgi:hypothetical protein
MVASWVCEKVTPSVKTIADITATRMITLNNKFATYDNRLSGTGIHTNKPLPTSPENPVIEPQNLKEF